MKEILIVLYAVILQLGIAVVLLGALIFLRHRKSSLKYFVLFLISLQANQMQLLLKTVTDYSGKDSSLFQGFIRFFELPGEALTIFVLCIFPFYIKGTKPSQFVKLCATGICSLFILNYFVSIHTKLTFTYIIDRSILVGVILFALIFVLSFLRNIGHPAMRRVMVYLSVLSLLFTPTILWEFIREGSPQFHHWWFIEPVPTYLLVLSCSGIYLFRKYFDLPSFIDLEKGTLSDYFKKNYNITPREEEIIMLLRTGKTYKEIAEKLTIAYKTVDTHIQNIYTKTAVTNKKQLLNLIDSSSL